MILSNPQNINVDIRSNEDLKVLIKQCTIEAQRELEASKPKPILVRLWKGAIGFLQMEDIKRRMNLVKKD